MKNLISLATTVAIACAALSGSGAVADVFSMTTPSQDGMLITSRIDTGTHTLYFDFDLIALPGNYEQIAFKPPHIPLSAIPFVSGSVWAPGLTEWNIHGFGTPNDSLELQFQQGNPPPRETTVTIDYSSDYQFTGEFLDATGTENVQVTLSNPPVGQDDNVSLWAFVPVLVLANQDSDGDQVPDVLDNCSAVANVDQRDTDADGLGNRCDADFNNDCMVNFIDLGEFKANFLAPGDTAYDLDGNGSVNFLDLAIMKASFLMPPGPSGNANDCSNP